MLTFDCWVNNCSNSFLLFQENKLFVSPTPISCSKEHFPPKNSNLNYFKFLLQK